MPPTSFSDMPTLATSPLSPPPQPFHRRRRSWCRKLERCCCTTFSYFPLVFVYGLTSWAVWVEVIVSLLGGSGASAYAQAGLGVVLYSLANSSYTIAVFTNPGSPLDPKQDLGRQRRDGGYEGLPTFENEEDVHVGAVPREWMTTVTAKSTGKPRYCKKCRVVKPDRTHHCSTCGRCVLKMDHHCPWLATCVGLRNYKPFLLFLVYICLFCYVCFATSAYWVWVELTNATQMTEGLRVVNTLILAVLSGIIGLVLSGFLGWHLYLTSTGQTTIESLEKTRYLSPLRKSLQTQSTAGRNYIGQDFASSEEDVNGDDQPLSERLKEIHANALPGVLRPEEGDVSLEPSRNPTPAPHPGNRVSGSPAHDSLRRSFASMEAQRERDRYSLYLDEQDSEKLPNAFNLGWKRNFLHVFGTNPLLWGLPICNTTGDGWLWDVSPAWVDIRGQIGRERQQRVQLQYQHPHGYRERRQHNFEPSPPPRRGPDWKWSGESGFVNQGPAPSNHPYPPSHLHNPADPQSPQPHSGSQSNDYAGVPMQALDRRKMGPGLEDGDERDNVDDEEGLRFGSQARRQDVTANWNDIPEDLLGTRNRVGTPSRSQGRRKGD